MQFFEHYPLLYRPFLFCCQSFCVQARSFLEKQAILERGRIYISPVVTKSETNPEKKEGHSHIPATKFLNDLSELGIDNALGGLGFASAPAAVATPKMR